MAQGKKLLVSLVVHNLTDLKPLPESSKSNRGWAECEGSPVMALDLLRQQDGRGHLIMIMYMTFCTAFALTLCTDLLNCHLPEGGDSVHPFSIYLHLKGRGCGLCFLKSILSSFISWILQ